MGLAELTEKRNRLDAKRKEFAAIWDEAGEDIDLSKAESLKSLPDTQARVKAVRDLQQEIDSLGLEVNSLAEMQKISEKARKERAEEKGEKDKKGEKDNDGGFKHGKLENYVSSLAKSILESGALKKGAGVKSFKLPAQPNGIKTLFQTTAGWAPETTRTGRLAEFAVRPLQVTDLFPQGTTSQAAVVYMEETTFTNAAAETAEGLAKPESALAYTERTEPIRKIATILPVTDEQLDDVPGIQSLLENRLMFMVRQRLDGQVLVGDGTAPNISGLTDRAIQQFNAVDMNLIEAGRRAMTLVRVTGRANPTAFIINPFDWEELVLTRTTDGIYIWGHPSTPGPATLWGLPVVESDILLEGSAVVGDFPAHSELVIRSDMDVQVSNSHEDFFAKNLQAIRAEMRAGLVVYRPDAFVEINNIGVTS